MSYFIIILQLKVSIQTEPMLTVAETLPEVVVELVGEPEMDRVDEETSTSTSAEALEEPVLEVLEAPEETGQEDTVAESADTVEEQMGQEELEALLEQLDRPDLVEYLSMVPDLRETWTEE